jgi:SAM-dependent methyltransferase
MPSLDGSPARNVIGIYRRHARAWSEARGNKLIEGGWIDRLLALLPPAPAILDLGCGTGAPIACELARRGAVVTGVDASCEMIAMFRRNLPGASAMVADMRNLALGRSFDGIVAWDSFFHLTADDQRAMFAVFGRHAPRQAALMFTSGPAEGEALGIFAGETLYHASLSASEYSALLAGQGFEVAAHRVEDPDCGGRTVWLARRGSQIER